MGAIDIYADRRARTAGAKGLALAAAATSGALAAIGLGAAVPLPGFAAVLGAAAVVVAPIFALAGRRRARRAFRTAIGPGGEESELAARLRAKAIADASETNSIAWPLTVGAVVTPLAWCGLIAAITEPDLIAWGRALIELAMILGPTSLVLGACTYSEARRLIDHRHKAYAPVLFTALVSGLTGFLYAGVEAAVTAATFMTFTASTFLTPGVWWARRKLRKERSTLEREALPPRDDATEETRRWLEAAVACAGAPASSRAEALRGLAMRFSIDRLDRVLDSALADPEPLIVQTALSICYEKRHRPALDRLLALLSSADPATLALLPQLLRRYSAPSVEPVLLSLLAATNAPEAQLAAAEALGLVGAISSVEPLHRAMRSAPAKLRATALEAIERIQIRHKRGQGGALSLAAEGEMGSVSLAPVESGALSVLKTADRGSGDAGSGG